MRQAVSRDRLVATRLARRAGKGTRDAQGAGAHGARLYDTTGWAALARPVRADWATLGHCAPNSVFDLIFDSVLFLSKPLDTVHEPG